VDEGTNKLHERRAAEQKDGKKVKGSKVRHLKEIAKRNQIPRRKH